MVHTTRLECNYSLTDATSLQFNKYLGPRAYTNFNLASKPFCLLTRRDQVGASAFQTATTGIQAVNRFAKSNTSKSGNTSDNDDD